MRIYTVVATERAGPADPLAHPVEDFTPVVNPLQTARTAHARSRPAGHVELVQIYPNSLDFEKPLVFDLTVCEHLALFTALDLRVERVGKPARFVEGEESHGGIVRKVQKSRRDLAVVQILQTPLPQTYA